MHEQVDARARPRASPPVQMRLGSWWDHVANPRETPAPAPRQAAATSWDEPRTCTFVTHLDICGCQYTLLPCLQDTLRYLSCAECPLLRTLQPPLPPKLMYMKFSKCDQLEALPCLRALPLVCLNVRACVGLRVIGALPRTFAHLDCRECVSLARLPAVQHCRLETLRCGRTAIVTLPPLPLGLQVLDANRCAALVALPALPASLRFVSCWGCVSMLQPQLAVPAGVRRLLFPPAARLPDAYPGCVQLSAQTWGKCVRARHARDRRRTLHLLPLAAALYV
jgi:hypothetical protein